MSTTQTVTRRLARIYAAQAFQVDALYECGRDLCGGKVPGWVRPVAVSLVSEFGTGARPREAEIAECLKSVPAYRSALSEGKVRPLIPLAVLGEAKMRPVAGAPESWGIPEALNFSSLANCLGMHMDDLGWLTMPWQTADHYHYRWHEKRSSGNKRLIEIPKPMMKLAQGEVLRRIVEKIPTHEAARGFRAGMSVFDFATPHTGRRMVLKLDLEEFFTSITSGRVVRLFMTAGYPETVAIVLARLCTNIAPRSVCRGKGLSNSSIVRLGRRHLPQGSPVSPGLANLCAFRMDCRLAGLAKSAGAVYTRYADDLLFSGDEGFARQARRFHIAALAIVLSEGFATNVRKTRFMTSSQRQYAAGLVLNEKPQVSRRDFDRLKAILTNCLRSGWKSQNRSEHPEFRSHLEGRIGWVNQGNPQRGEKLLSIFEKIDWS